MEHLRADDRQKSSYCPRRRTNRAAAGIIRPLQRNVGTRPLAGRVRALSGFRRAVHDQAVKTFERAGTLFPIKVLCVKVNAFSLRRCTNGGSLRKRIIVCTIPNASTFGKTHACTPCRTKRPTLVRGRTTGRPIAKNSGSFDGNRYSLN